MKFTRKKRLNYDFYIVSSVAIIEFWEGLGVVNPVNIHQ